MNKHTQLNKSFDLSGMPAGVVGARSWSEVASRDCGQYASGRLELSRPLMV